jgi:hypothetical protein
MSSSPLTHGRGAGGEGKTLSPSGFHVKLTKILGASGTLAGQNEINIIVSTEATLQLKKSTITYSQRFCCSDYLSVVSFTLMIFWLY